MNRASLASRLIGTLAALAGLGTASTAPAQSVSASEAPAAWIAYAETAAATLSAWLEEEGEAPNRLRAYLHQTRPAEDQPTPPLMLKVWIDRDGVVDRLDFTPFAHEAANADLRASVVGRRLSAPPPPDMLLPLRIAVEMPAGGEDEVDKATV